MGKCKLWKGCTGQDGYGVIKIADKQYRVHRLAYELSKGEIPKGLVIHHTCRNILCINPKHLQAITSKDNIRIDAKLNYKLVDKIRNLYQTGEYSHRQLGKLFNVNYRTIGFVVNKKTWS